MLGKRENSLNKCVYLGHRALLHPTCDFRPQKVIERELQADFQGKDKILYYFITPFCAVFVYSCTVKYYCCTVIYYYFTFLFLCTSLFYICTVILYHRTV